MHTSTDSRRGIGQKNAAFWTSVALHYARHKPDGGADRPARSLETKWSDIKQAVAKFTGCYESMKGLDESGKSEDDVILDAMNLYKQKCGKAFVFKHCWFLLKSYHRFAAIFIGKRKAGGFDLPNRNALPVDRRDLVSPNGEALPTASAPAYIRPQGVKASKVEHVHNKVKKQALRANAKATNEFAAATLKKAKQIAQQNTFSLFTLKDRLITCDLARQWLHLRRTQELAKLKAEVAAEAAASNVAAPPLATQLLRMSSRCLRSQLRSLVHLLLQRQAVDQVLEVHHARNFGEDRERVRIPFEQDLVRLDRVAFGFLDDGRRPVVTLLGQLFGRPFGTRRKAEAELARLTHQNRDDVGEFLVQRAFSPRVLAALQHPLHRVFGQRHHVVQQLRAQKILKRRRRELRIQLQRNPQKRLEILA